MEAVLENVTRRVFVHYVRWTKAETDNFKRGRPSLVVSRFIAESGQLDQNRLPDNYYRMVGSAMKAICADFFRTSGDSEIQVSKMVKPLSAMLAQRPGLVVAAFSPAQHSAYLLMQMHNASMILHPNTFMHVYQEDSRKTVWLFCAIVLHSANRLSARSASSWERWTRGTRAWMVCAWMSRNVCAWTASVPSLMLVDEVLQCRRAYLAHTHTATSDAQNFVSHDASSSSSSSSDDGGRR